MSGLLNLRFVIVAGKGGVGKTTVSTALALAAARQGKRVLIAMCNAKERVSDLLEVAPIGSENQTILPGIDAVNMNPQVALEEYGMMVLRVRTLYRAIFENRLVAAFLRGTPGIEAWSMLGKAQFHARETRPDGTPRYDMVILDAPATGHGLEMLRVPKVLMDVAPPGLLRREAEKAWALFSDRERAGVLLVTLPEDMPVNETFELHAALTGELGLPVSGVVVNSVVSTLFFGEEAAWIQRVAGESQPSDLVHSVLVAARRRTRQQASQAECIERLSQRLALPQVQLPALMVAELKRAELNQLADAFGAEARVSRAGS